MKKPLLLLFVVITIIAGASKSASAQVPLYIEDAFKKAALPADDKGQWIVYGNVRIIKPSGEVFEAFGPLALAGNNVLAGNLELKGLKSKDGVYIEGKGGEYIPMPQNTMWLILSKEAGPLNVMLRHDIAGKPFLGRPAVQAKLNNLTESALKGTIMWDGKDSQVRIAISPLLKSPPATPTAAKETAAQIIAKTPGLIAVNTVLVRNTPYYSPDKKHYLIFQGDGNLVVYRIAGTAAHAIWSTGTNVSVAGAMAFGAKAVFQMDGNLVVYDIKNRAVWDSISDLKRRDAKKWYEYLDFAVGIDSESMPVYSKIVWLSMQNDGNLVVYRGSHPPDGYAFWHSQ